MRIDERGRLVPDFLLGAHPPLRTSTSHATIVDRLRQGGRWHEGRLVSAAAVLATDRALMDARNPVQTRLAFDRIASVNDTELGFGVGSVFCSTIQ